MSGVQTTLVSQFSETELAWAAELVHDPNQHGIPPVVGPSGYIMIGKL